MVAGKRQTGSDGAVKGGGVKRESDGGQVVAGSTSGVA